MRKSPSLVLFAPMLLLLAGCPTMSQHYLAQPQAIKAEGSYIHRPSGMTFPQAVGDFHRSAMFDYDMEGFDVSAGYDLTDFSRAITATVYVYPAPSLISIGSPADVVASARATLTQGEFDKREREIFQAHPDAEKINESVVSLQQSGKSYSGKMASFEFEDFFGGQRLMLSSRLYLFCYVGDKWAIEYRFTYPKNSKMTNEIDVFMQDLQWTLENQ